MLYSTWNWALFQPYFWKKDSPHHEVGDTWLLTTQLSPAVSVPNGIKVTLLGTMDKQSDKASQFRLHDFTSGVSIRLVAILPRSAQWRELSSCPGLCVPFFSERYYFPVSLCFSSSTFKRPRWNRLGKQRVTREDFKDNHGSRSSSPGQNEGSPAKAGWGQTGPGDLIKASDLELKDPDNPKMHHLERTQTCPTLRNRKHSLSNYFYSWHLPCKVTLVYKFDFLISWWTLEGFVWLILPVYCSSLWTGTQGRNVEVGSMEEHHLRARSQALA